MVIPTSVVIIQLFQVVPALGPEGIAPTCWIAVVAKTVEAVSLAWGASTVGSSSLGASGCAGGTLGSSIEGNSVLGNDMATVGSVLSFGSSGWELTSAEMAILSTSGPAGPPS